MPTLQRNPEGAQHVVEDDKAALRQEAEEDEEEEDSSALFSSSGSSEKPEIWLVYSKAGRNPFGGARNPFGHRPRGNADVRHLQNQNQTFFCRDCRRIFLMSENLYQSHTIRFSAKS